MSCDTVLKLCHRKIKRFYCEQLNSLSRQTIHSCSDEALKLETSSFQPCKNKLSIQRTVKAGLFETILLKTGLVVLFVTQRRRGDNVLWRISKISHEKNFVSQNTRLQTQNKIDINILSEQTRFGSGRVRLYSFNL